MPELLPRGTGDDCARERGELEKGRKGKIKMGSQRFTEEECVLFPSQLLPTSALCHLQRHFSMSLNIPALTEVPIIIMQASL